MDVPDTFEGQMQVDLARLGWPPEKIAASVGALRRLPAGARAREEAAWPQILAQLRRDEDVRFAQVDRVLRGQPPSPVVLRILACMKNYQRGDEAEDAPAGGG